MRGTGGLVAAALALAAALSGCASSGPAAGREPAPAADWQPIAAAPFAARAGAVTAWTGSEALFLGGDTGPPCPPDASCVAGPQDTTDGAAYDPDTDTWRGTAAAPEPILSYSAHVLIGATIYLWGRSDLLAYDSSSDRWTAFAAPPALRGVALAALAGTVVAVPGERRAGAPSGRALDPDSGRWTPLPPDPIGPAFDRDVTTIPGGVVLTAHDLVPDPGANGPSVLRAAVLDAGTMTWRLLPDSDQLGGGAWAWTGRRLVLPALGGADGGEIGNWGRTVPDGGTLDPATGTWGRLPDPPRHGALAHGELWAVYAPGGDRYATAGWVYDDATRTWTALAPPPGAPDGPGDAVWAGDRLIVVGGIESEGPARSSGAWSITFPR